MTNRTININVPMLARVEGEGALDLTIEANQIKQAQLHIYEPPRLFEKFLQGRDYQEVIDIVARICGICPVAYQMSAVVALEQICGLQISPWVRAMRRLFYCGEWLESHSLHIHLLALPDFLGFNSAPEMAKQYPDEVKRGLRMQALGNELVALFGGRSVHPVGACVGGFYHCPSQDKVQQLLEKFKASLADAEAMVYWTAELPLPDEQSEFTCVALHHDDEYAINEGDVVSSQGLRISKEDYDKHFVEFQVPHSTALHSLLDDKPYLVGPLARLNLNYQQLPDAVKQVVAKLPFSFPSYNMFHSVVARAVEIYYAVYEAIRLLESFVTTTEPAVTPIVKAGIGFGATEAPRGLLWHRYEMDEVGLIKTARIVPPTSQNQARIEEDLRQGLQAYGLQHSDAELRLHSEMIIRNYDPCISCSTHFLDLRVKRL